MQSCFSSVIPAEMILTTQNEFWDEPTDSGNSQVKLANWPANCQIRLLGCHVVNNSHKQSEI